MSSRHLSAILAGLALVAAPMGASTVLAQTPPAPTAASLQATISAAARAAAADPGFAALTPQQKLAAIPPELASYNLALTDDGHALVYTYEAQGEHRGVTRLVEGLLRQNIRLKDINTTQSSLEDIFVDLVRKDA